MSKRYVQHMSVQGEKWLVDICADNKEAWMVFNADLTHLRLPKSEYCLCEPPEVWVECTQTCSFNDGALLDHPEEGGHGWMVLRVDGCVHGEGYRLRKIALDDLSFVAGKPQKCAFIVERRLP